MSETAQDFLDEDQEEPEEKPSKEPKEKVEREEHSICRRLGV